tara:strand:- start:2226 stop:3461 length:1236 start_codon:yes stop_codon:yes gene_type:complete
MGVETYLRGILRDYYKSVEVTSVPDISSREFGFGEFGKKISSRHLAFSDNSQLNSFLRERTPFYISYSNAHYEFPDARPMEKKIMLGADLIYEFDADDIETECKLLHDSWECKSCNVKGKGNVERCDKCGSGVKVEEWVCPECVGETKKQTQTLLKLLENDFAFTEGISINFSGSKGFHVHIRGDNVQSLSKAARLELLDYITATNLDLKSLGFVYSPKKVFHCPKKSKAMGWSKKLLDGVENLLAEGNISKISAMASRDKHNVTEGTVKKLLKEKQSIISGMERGFLLSLPGLKADRFWESVLNYIAEEQTLEVDRQTSIDINKIIRVPNTIHGSTGLNAMELSGEELPSFDALKESVVLSDEEVKLMNVSAPKFYVKGNWFGPFIKEEVSLPKYAAFYLLSRGNAELGV